MEKLNISTQLIIKAAEKLGAKAEVLEPEKVVELKLGDKTEHLYSIVSSKTTAPASMICQNKYIAKHLLKKCGISMANGKVFGTSKTDDAKAYFNTIKKPVVLKPLDSAKGFGVIMEIETIEEFESAWNKLKSSKEIIVEEQFDGSETRIFVTKDKFIAASQRIPANVTGDGVHTIAELIEIKNSDPKRTDDNYIEKNSCLIIVDEVVLEKISKNGLTLESVPKKDEKIYLRDNSNMSTGGDSVDVTDEVHGSVKEIALKAIKAIPGLAYAGIDFMSKDIAKDHTDNDYIIIEINSNPGIMVHHNPVVGQSRDVASEIVKVIFDQK